MTGRLIIDGVDAFTEFGVYVTEGGYNELIAYPSLKAVDSNDWPDEHGIDPDLSAPALDPKELTILFASRSDFRAFIDFLTTPGYREFNFASIGVTRQLRYIKQTALDVNDGLDIFSAVFSEDMPSAIESTPSGGVAVDSGYQLDGTSFVEYGITPLNGCLSEVVKAPEVKQALVINTVTTGIIYDEEAPVFFKSKEVKLNLLIRAESLSDLFANYYTLLFDLTRPGARTLGVAAAGKEYSCYYKAGSVETFLPAHCWLRFGITLVFIDNGQTI